MKNAAKNNLLNLGINSNEEDEDIQNNSQSEHDKELKRWFYKVSNHQELYKIGSSFYEDFQSGLKSFAISSTGYPLSQQKSILGLASYFDHQTDIKMVIVSDNLFGGPFKHFVDKATEEFIMDHHDNEVFKIASFGGVFDFVDLDSFILMRDDVVKYNNALNELFNQYDVVFWDVPELERIKESSEAYFPVLKKFESLSIIVSQNSSSIKVVDEVKSFFEGYGINLKGLLFDINNETFNIDIQPESKRSFWNLFKREK